MESLWTFLGGEETASRVFRIQGRSDFRRGEITNFKQENKGKEPPGPLPPLEVAVRL